MINALRTAWTKPRTVRGLVFAIVAAVALMVAAIAFIAGLAIGAIAVPLHEHILRASDTVSYPISTERRPHVDAGTLALVAAAAFTLALGLLFFCLWTAFILMLASVLSRRRGA